MTPYDIGSAWYEQQPQTALTPKIVAHGGGNNLRVLKGNPVGHVIHPDGTMHPYLSARMEHSHQPLEHAMLIDGTLQIDHYRLGNVMPSRAAGAPGRHIQPSATAPHKQWPDTSVSSSFADPPFGHGALPFGPGSPYNG
jgi:hypothetical protein